jgi:hypothetical protein
MATGMCRTVRGTLFGGVSREFFFGFQEHERQGYDQGTIMI